MLFPLVTCLVLSFYGLEKQFLCLNYAVETKMAVMLQMGSLLELKSVQILDFFIMIYFCEKINTRSLQYDIRCNKIEVPATDILTALKYH